MAGRPKLNPDEDTRARKLKASESWWRRVDEAARDAGIPAAELIRRIVDAALRDDGTH